MEVCPKFEHMVPVLVVLFGSFRRCCFVEGSVSLEPGFESLKDSHPLLCLLDAYGSTGLQSASCSYHHAYYLLPATLFQHHGCIIPLNLGQVVSS